MPWPGLVFSSIYHRADVIEHAEHGTFSWMVQDSDPKAVQPGENSGSNARNEQDIMRDKVRQKFLTWLNSGRHIFHISGKPGSGKSTLMKYLRETPRVQTELHALAGDQSLIFAQFFFWSFGEKLQMSLEGLYRSLLFEFCRQAPDLIPRIFPDTWEGLSSGFAPPQQTPFRLEEIKVAFNRLVQESCTLKGAICFFIDGLDEFQGDDVDHWHIARDLQSWTQSEKIKLCVSSRPHIPFLQTFSSPGNIQIHIHELTREDIRQFGLAMFEKDPNFDRVKDTYQSQVDDVVHFSNGVFLWARLVVRSLLRSIGYQGTKKDLHRKLMSMPKGLDERFDWLLGLIDSNDQHLSDVLFLLIIPEFCRWKLTVEHARAYSWLEDLADPDFPWNRPMVPCSEEDIKQRLQRVSCLLDRLSRGLLEIIRIRSQPSDYFTYKVQFHHRTARDYLAGTRQAQMRSRAPNVDVHGDILRLLLAQLKFARPTASHTYRDGSQENHFDYRGHAQLAATTEEGQSYHAETYMAGVNLEMSSDGLWPLTAQSYHPSCFLSENIQADLYKFLPSKLKGRLRRQNELSGPNILAVVCTACKSVELVQELLSEGRSPNEMVRIEKLSMPGYRGYGHDDFKKEGNAFSVWMLFLYNAARSALSKTSNCPTIASILEMFLQFDVERDVQFIVSRGYNNTEKFTMSLLEIMEWANPPNFGTIRSILQTEAAPEGQNSSQLDRLEITFARYCETIDNPVKILRGYRIDSVVTPSERLDVPFSYQIR